MTSLIFASALATVFAALLFVAWRNAAHLRQQSSTLQTKVAVADERNTSLQREQQVSRDELVVTKAECERLRENARIEVLKLASELGEARAVIEASVEKLQFIELAKKQLTADMKVIAQEVLTKNSQELSLTQHEKLTATLAPFKETLSSLNKKVEETDRVRATEQGLLSGQLEQLMKASSELDKDAKDLTKALKSDNKTVGNWGEMVLERVLESAGLNEGREYQTQKTEQDNDGNYLRPDVVIRLPESKNLIVDSKVSLKSWVEYSTDPTDANWNAVAASLKTHVHGLSKKNYADLYGLSSVDFVLLFVPIESAFLEFVRREPELSREAWERRVMMVGPGNLQWALRMVASIWRFEDQNQNAQQIASEAARMYDKFVGFVEDLDKLGGSLNGAARAFNDARGKLLLGKGNLVRKAEELKKLGVSPKKSLPSEVTIAGYIEGLSSAQAATNGVLLPSIIEASMS